jgi:hypothetical protein
MFSHVALESRWSGPVPGADACPHSASSRDCCRGLRTGSILIGSTTGGSLDEVFSPSGLDRILHVMNEQRR